MNFRKVVLFISNFQTKIMLCRFEKVGKLFRNGYTTHNQAWAACNAETNIPSSDFCTQSTRRYHVSTMTRNGTHSPSTDFCSQSRRKYHVSSMTRNGTHSGSKIGNYFGTQNRKYHPSIEISKEVIKMTEYITICIVILKFVI